MSPSCKDEGLLSTRKLLCCTMLHSISGVPGENTLRRFGASALRRFGGSAVRRRLLNRILRSAIPPRRMPEHPGILCPTQSLIAQTIDGEYRKDAKSPPNPANPVGDLLVVSISTGASRRRRAERGSQPQRQPRRGPRTCHITNDGVPLAGPRSRPRESASVQVTTTGHRPLLVRQGRPGCQAPQITPRLWLLPSVGRCLQASEPWPCPAAPRLLAP